MTGLSPDPQRAFARPRRRGPTLTRRGRWLFAVAIAAALFLARAFDAASPF